MGIKISQVIQESEARKAAGPPLPRLKSKVVAIPLATAAAIVADALQHNPGAAIPITHAPKDALLKDLYDQLGQVKRDRSVLSSGSAAMISRIRLELEAKEGKSIADSFMRGEFGMPEIKEHYARIQACTERAISLWDKIKHVEKYGVLPGTQQVIVRSKDEAALKTELRSVVDTLSKTRKKLKVGNAYNPARIMMWEEKVSQLEARQQDLQAQIKKLQNDARNSG